MVGTGRLTMRRHGSSRPRLWAPSAALLLIGCTLSESAPSESSATATPEALASWREQILQADRDFDADSAARGSAAWAERFLADGRMVGGSEVTVGPEAVRAALTMLDDPSKVTLRWQPAEAEVAASGDLGYTRGTYRRVFARPDGSEVVATGSYLTVWRREGDGPWRIALDIGSPDPPKPAQ